MKRLVAGVLIFLLTLTFLGCTLTQTAAETTTVDVTTTTTSSGETTTVSEAPRDNDSLIEEIADLIKGIFED